MEIIETKQKQVTNDKYDRQKRLWGSHGQYQLMNSHICLLGCDPVGVETLKNLVLPGIGKFTVVDDKKITERDLGNNFFVDEDSLGKDRAEVICKNLNEMNPDVAGCFIKENPQNLLNEKDYVQFSLIICSEQPQKFFVKLFEICEKLEKPLIVVFTYGLIGYMRLYSKEHPVWETKPQLAQIDDLRIFNPFPELKQYFLSFNFDDLKNQSLFFQKQKENENQIDEAFYQQSHIPYPVILYQALEKWKFQNQGQVPSTYEQSLSFEQTIREMAITFKEQENFNEAVKHKYKAFKNPSEIPDHITNLFNNKFCLNANSQSNKFWILVSALKKFYEKNGVLPLLGMLPDMTALSQHYITLNKIFKNKAKLDREELKAYIQAIYQGQNSNITEEEVQRFQENDLTIDLLHYRSYKEEVQNPISIECFENDVYKWYFGMRGVFNFFDQFNRFPSVNEPNDATILNDIINKDILKKDHFPSLLPIEQEIFNELCRYEGAQLHNIAAFVGGVASQEAVKLITGQFIPLNHTFVFCGITSETAIFEV